MKIVEVRESAIEIFRDATPAEVVAAISACKRASATVLCSFICDKWRALAAYIYDVR